MPVGALNKLLTLFLPLEHPFFNVLTRTSGRPKGFNRCHFSLLKQTGRVNHIVSYDSDEDLKYLDNYNDVDIVKVNPVVSPPNPMEEKEFKPYNLYCNELLDRVKDGWILFLDDDDMLAHPKVLKKLARNIRRYDEDTLFIYYSRFPDGSTLPPDYTFKERKIKLQHIDTACFCFHSKYKDSARWDAYWAADYRFIKDLSGIIPKQVWIPEVLTLKNNFGDGGNRNDIENS